MIDAIRRDQSITVQLEEGGPISLMPEKAFSKRTIVDDTDFELTVATEYRLSGSDRVVHRSAHVQLKRPVTAELAVGGIGG